MAVKWARVLTYIIIILVIIALAMFVKQVLSGPSATNLMIDTIELYSNNDTIERAELISAIDTNVKKLESESIITQWDTLTGCIGANSCSQDNYFDLLLLVAVEQADSIPNSDIIVNIITVNRYWGNPDKIIEFSKALSKADEQIELVEEKTIKNKWQEVVYCDGKCPEYHPLFFDFVRLLLAV